VQQNSEDDYIVNPSVFFGAAPDMNAVSENKD